MQNLPGKFYSRPRLLPLRFCAAIARLLIQLRQLLPVFMSGVPPCLPGQLLRSQAVCKPQPHCLFPFLFLFLLPPAKGAFYGLFIGPPDLRRWLYPDKKLCSFPFLPIGNGLRFFFYASFESLLTSPVSQIEAFDHPAEQKDNAHKHCDDQCHHN